MLIHARYTDLEGEKGNMCYLQAETKLGLTLNEAGRDMASTVLYVGIPVTGNFNEGGIPWIQARDP